MTAAQIKAKAALELPILRCKAKLGSDRCTLQENHRKAHETVGPTGAKLTWTAAGRDG